MVFEIGRRHLRQVGQQFQRGLIALIGHLGDAGRKTATSAHRLANGQRQSLSPDLRGDAIDPRRPPAVAGAEVQLRFSNC